MRCRSLRCETVQEVSSLMMADEDDDGHWVENLFRPIFGIDDASSDYYLQKQAPPPSVFEQLARNQISAEDVPHIKNVYERVWLMARIKDKEEAKLAEEKKQETLKREEKEHLISRIKSSTLKSSLKSMFRDEEFEQDDDQESTKHTIGDLSNLLSSISQPEQAAENLTEEPIDLDDSCIWSSKEIDVLRAVFKTAKTRNSRLRATVEITQEENRKLESKLSKQSKTLDVRTKNLQEAKKANDRLHILSKNLKDQLDKSEAKVNFLHEELSDVRDELTGSKKNVHNLTLELDKERLERQKVESDLTSEQQTAARELELREERLRLDHEREVVKLQKQLLETMKLLEQERQEHDRSKRGLDHLRTHFASLPLEVKEPHRDSGPVVQDQLTKWTY